MTFASAIYVGSVTHRRLRPKRYRLRHAVFWTLLDLDEIDHLDKQSRLFSRNRFNAVSFFDRDHGDQSATPLRLQIERHLGAAGLDLEGGPIRLLCMPRILGYGFNPLSIYFCYRTDDALAAVVYEVRNTFGQRHSYLIPVNEKSGAIHQTCGKDFYVSPFMDMDMQYDFRLTPPGTTVSAVVTAGDATGTLIVASLSGRRQTFSEGVLIGLLARIPMLTLKVIGAIHWHALKMWLRGFQITARPSAPDSPITIVRPGNN